MGCVKNSPLCPFDNKTSGGPPPLSHTHAAHHGGEVWRMRWYINRVDMFANVVEAVSDTVLAVTVKIISFSKIFLRYDNVWKTTILQWFPQSHSTPVINADGDTYRHHVVEW